MYKPRTPMYKPRIPMYKQRLPMYKQRLPMCKQIIPMYVLCASLGALRRRENMYEAQYMHLRVFLMHFNGEITRLRVRI